MGTTLGFKESTRNYVVLFYHVFKRYIKQILNSYMKNPNNIFFIIIFF